MTLSSSHSTLDLRLSGDRPCRTEDLPGFSKKVGHAVPLKIDDHADALLAQWVDPWVNERATTLHQALRMRFGFKRSAFQFRRTTGAIELSWPLGRSRFWAEWVPESAAQALLRIEVNPLGGGEFLENAVLMEVLAAFCNTVHVRPPASVSVEDLIDRIEANPENASSLDYPLDASWLRFSPPPHSVEFSADAESWRFRALAGSNLVEIAAKASQLLDEWIAPQPN